MANSQFNAIVILDAIPKGEFNTARRLHEDLLDIASYIHEGLEIRFVRIDTIDDLRLGLTNIFNEITHNGLKPWLHLEGHGLQDESGFALANGLPCSWIEFKNIITPLNIALGLNLVVVLATCFGGFFASALHPVDRAPVLGLIGPTKAITTGEAHRAFPAFYKTFFESLSLPLALKALDAGTPKGLYLRTTAEQFFYAVWAGYKRKYSTVEEIEKRAHRIQLKLLEQNFAIIPNIRKIMQDSYVQESKSFEKIRNTFFMYDINGQNRERFPVTYKKAEANLNNR